MAAPTASAYFQTSQHTHPHLHPLLGDQHGVRVPPPQVGRVEPWLDGQDHAGLENRRITEIEEGDLVVAQADSVAAVVAPEGHQVVVLVILAHGPIDLGAAHAGPQGLEGDLLGALHMVEHAMLLVRGPADDHGPLQLRVVAPHGCPGPAHQHVAGLEGDVVGQGVGDGRPPADLPTI